MTDATQTHLQMATKVLSSNENSISLLMVFLHLYPYSFSYYHLSFLLIIIIFFFPFFYTFEFKILNKFHYYNINNFYFLIFDLNSFSNYLFYFLIIYKKIIHLVIFFYNYVIPFRRSNTCQHQTHRWLMCGLFLEQCLGKLLVLKTSEKDHLLNSEEGIHPYLVRTNLLMWMHF